MRSTSLGVAKVGNLKFDFMVKSIRIHFFGFENILDVIEIPKPRNPFWPYGHLNSLLLICRPLPCETSQDCYFIL